MGYLNEVARVTAAIGRLMALNPRLARCSPTNLRVGIDLTKADMAGLAALLIEKGVFTKDEYIAAITKASESEAETYEKEVREAYGIPTPAEAARPAETAKP